MEKIMHNSERFLRVSEVLERTGLKKSTMYAMIQENQFPKPINISTRSAAWLESELDNWMSRKIKESRGTDYRQFVQN